MTLASFICCCLTLSSVALGQSSYGSYSSGPLTRPTTVSGSRLITSQTQPTEFLPQNGYGAEKLPMKQEPIRQERTFISQGYGSQSPMSISSRVLPNTQPSTPVLPEPEVLTEADIRCRGQLPETVIQTHNGRRFIVCLADGKGVEQHCPYGLFYHLDTHKCERKLGHLSDPCDRQPCLNGGRCSRLESSFKCDCPAGFDGKSCEFDARICQTQQPCGLSDDVRCQSFRWGAALSYVCIFKNGRGYGLNAQQINENPCKDEDKIQPLSFTDKGFILCDGEIMSVEACPGGTVWDDNVQACVWEDLQGFGGKQLPIKSSYDTQLQIPQGSSIEQRRVISVPEQTQSYGSQSLFQQQPQIQRHQQQEMQRSQQQPEMQRSQQQPEMQRSQQQPEMQRSQQQEMQRSQQQPEMQLTQEQPQMQSSQQQEQTRFLQPSQEQTRVAQLPQSGYSYGSHEHTRVIPPTQSGYSYGSQQQIPKASSWQQKMVIKQDPLPISLSYSGY